MEVSQSHPTLCDPVDCIVHRMLQARILEWIAVLFFRESSKPSDQTQVSHIAGRFFTYWAIRETLSLLKKHSQFQWFAPTLEYSVGKVIPWLGSVTQSYLTLYKSLESSPPGSFVHRIFQARILKQCAISNTGLEPTSLRSPALAGRFFTTRTTWEALDTLINTRINPIHVPLWTYICISNFD